MKKTLVSALTGALVLGAAATTFAAANPFEDVAADHWAYDAVAQLAADGIIEGYGDGTYRGDQEITRYEMAQLVARAMAKGDVSPASKATIEKLAAEFQNELSSLGVRVAALEKKVDNVKWGGRLRYRYFKRTEEHTDRTAENLAGTGNTQQYLLRLEPTARINQNWVGKARLDYGASDNANTAKNDEKVTVDRIYVEGTYGNTKILLGKFPGFMEADYGMTFDYRMSGAKVTFGKNIKVGITAGRLNGDNAKVFWDGNDATLSGANGVTGSYQSIAIYNDRAKKFTWGLGYQRLTNADKLEDTMGNKTANIWTIGLGYKFNKDFNATAAFAWNTAVDDTKAGSEWDTKGKDRSSSKFKNSYNFQLNYKGAKASQKNSWGAFIAYRHLGNFSTVHPTYIEFGPVNAGERGWEIGLSWAPLKNVVGKVQYFSGKELIDDNNVHALWTELSFIF